MINKYGHGKKCDGWYECSQHFPTLWTHYAKQIIPVDVSDIWRSWINLDYNFVCTETRLIRIICVHSFIFYHSLRYKVKQTEYRSVCIQLSGWNWYNVGELKIANWNGKSSKLTVSATVYDPSWTHIYWWLHIL